MFRRALLSSLAALGLLAFLPSPAAARQAVSDAVPQTVADSAPPPAYIARAEGAVALEHDGASDGAPLNAPLISGDRLRTSRGRADVSLPGGGAMQLDESTTVDFQSETLLRLLDGRIHLTLPARGATVRVDSPAGSVRISQAGEYRLAVLRGDAGSGRDAETQLELAVVRGGADIYTDEGTTTVRSGERAYASAGLVPSYTYPFNSAAQDDFSQWADADRYNATGASAQYLPADMRNYSTTFDEYGDWRYDQGYGYVWYPRVAAEWRPYYYGRWAAYPRYGWTWIGADRFAWPTHHYGRWGFSAGAWFWIPSRVWAPAYVSWAYAPGYVSWCPLGFNNRPVVGINVSLGHGYSPWQAWTVVSAPFFGHGYVNQRVIRVNTLDARFRSGFQARPTAPAFRDHLAVPRGSVARHANAAFDSRRGTASTRDGRLQTGAPIGTRAASPEVPRFVNRGNEIIRSQTARPVAPRRTEMPNREANVPRALPSQVPAIQDRARERTSPVAGPNGVVRPNSQPGSIYQGDYRANGAYRGDYRANGAYRGDYRANGAYQPTYPAPGPVRREPGAPRVIAPPASRPAPPMPASRPAQAMPRAEPQPNRAPPSGASAPRAGSGGERPRPGGAPAAGQATPRGGGGRGRG